MRHHAIRGGAAKLSPSTSTVKDEVEQVARALGEVCTGTGPAHEQRGVSVYACSVGCRRSLQILGVGVGGAYAYADEALGEV